MPSRLSYTPKGALAAVEAPIEAVKCKRLALGVVSGAGDKE